MALRADEGIRRALRADPVIHPWDLVRSAVRLASPQTGPVTRVPSARTIDQRGRCRSDGNSGGGPLSRQQRP